MTSGRVLFTIPAAPRENPSLQARGRAPSLLDRIWHAVQGVWASLQALWEMTQSCCFEGLRRRSESSSSSSSMSSSFCMPLLDGTSSDHEECCVADLIDAAFDAVLDPNAEPVGVNLLTDLLESLLDQLPADVFAQDMYAREVLHARVNHLLREWGSDLNQQEIVSFLKTLSAKGLLDAEFIEDAQAFEAGGSAVTGGSSAL